MTLRQEAPRIIHFNDCANVAKTLVEAARDSGLQWDFMPPSEVRPAGGFGVGPRSLLTQLPFQARHAAALIRHDVVHIHYATAVGLLQKPYLPRRPYILHLHGTDIRTQWLDPSFKAQIQAAVDGANAVYYTTPDLRENATAARTDARYMPAPVRFDEIPPWTPGEGARPRVVFASRWEESKGLSKQLETASALVAALGGIADILGLDWGPGAKSAGEAGVMLVPKMSHGAYLRYLASADVVIGQSTGALGLSELEAMAIGAVVICPGKQLSLGDERPPVLQGSIQEVVEQVVESLKDSQAVSKQLDAVSWTRLHHSAQKWIPVLDEVYRKAALAGTN